MSNKDYLKKLYIKAKRRGMLELDLVIGYVADNYLYSMSAEEVKLFDEFLDTEDSILYRWLMQEEPVALKYQNTIWPLIENYKNNNL